MNLQESEFYEQMHKQLIQHCKNNEVLNSIYNFYKECLQFTDEHIAKSAGCVELIVAMNTIVADQMLTPAEEPIQMQLLCGHLDGKLFEIASMGKLVVVRFLKPPHGCVRTIDFKQVSLS